MDGHYNLHPIYVLEANFSQFPEKRAKYEMIRRDVRATHKTGAVFCIVIVQVLVDVNVYMRVFVFI